MLFKPSEVQHKLMNIHTSNKCNIHVHVYAANLKCYSEHSGIRMQGHVSESFNIIFIIFALHVHVYVTIRFATSSWFWNRLLLLHSKGNLALEGYLLLSFIRKNCYCIILPEFLASLLVQSLSLMQWVCDHGHKGPSPNKKTTPTQPHRNHLQWDWNSAARPTEWMVDYSTSISCTHSHMYCIPSIYLHVWHKFA